MGFWDNILKLGKAYSGKREARLACELTVDGQQYMLEEFDMNFDHQSVQRYISMYAVFGEKLSPELEAWISRSSQRKDGRVRFYRNSEQLEEGAVFDLMFHDTVCIRYSKSAYDNGHPQTTLVLAAKRIKLMNEEYEPR
ncbi:MAG: hypothetical protein LBV02_00180 [Bacteroidales bacterium]|jgi:hypothetical protein|nr:hypothetical protein [Bacteroidales bacterium]